MYMKSRSIKLVLLAASILANPVFTFAGGQPNTVYTPGKNEAQNLVGVGRSLNQGKGAGMTRSDGTLRGNAYRSQTADDNRAVRNKPDTTGPNFNDSGFHK
jgi:hypothetical protein